jgi:hypothetical protein
MVLKAVQWETETLGRRVLDETVIHNGQVLRRESLRIKKLEAGHGVRFVALLNVEFDAYDGFSGYVCPFCGGTERTNCCECANCGVRR